MTFDVIATPKFKKDLKSLAKKYPSIKKEFSELITLLENDPKQGDPLGHHCYKIRMAIASKGKGKSGGARIITYVHIVAHTVYLLSIYDKSDRESISDNELKSLLRLIP